MNKEYIDLKKAVSLGIIDVSNIQERLAIREREECLNQHKNKIWKSDKDGYYRTYVPDDQKERRLVKSKTIEGIEDAIVKAYRVPLGNPTLREVFEEWNDRRLELRKISKATHARNTQLFDRYFLGEFDSVRIKSIDPLELVEFLEEQIPRYDLTAKDFSNLKTVVRGIFKRAKKRKLIDWNIDVALMDIDTTDNSFKQVYKEDDEEVFTEDDLDSFMSVLMADLDEKNLAILLMFLTGIRVGELVSIKHEDLCYEDLTIKIHRTESREPDGNGGWRYVVRDKPKTRAGIRTVIIPNDYAWVMQRLKLCNPFSEYIFYNTKGERMTTPSIRSRMKGVCAKAGIKQKSPHKVRRTYASILLDNNVDNRMIEDLMGHTDIACTERYYHKTRRSIERKSEALSDIPEFSSRFSPEESKKINSK